jgi:arylmalonate decarboxylase
LTAAAPIKPRLRVGYVSPHPLVDTLAYEFYLMAPPGIMMMAACIEISDYTTAAVEDQLEPLDRRIGDLVRRGASRVIISGVPVAIALGRDRMTALRERLAARWGLPVDTDLEAIIAAASHLGLGRIGLATRWKAEMNAKLAEYLGEAGIEVVETASSPRSMAENSGLDDQTGMDLAVELGSRVLAAESAPEGVIIPGGRWITVGAIRDLEARFDRPVITNYSAGLWAALRQVDDLPRISDWGRLLRTLGA